MPRSGRQGGVEGKKLPPLVVRRPDAVIRGQSAIWPRIQVDLALGVAAGFLLGGGQGGLRGGVSPRRWAANSRTPTAFMRRQVADQGRGPAGRATSSRAPLADHGLQPGVAAGVERGAGRLQGHAVHQRPARSGAAADGLPVAERAARWPHRPPRPGPAAGGRPARCGRRRRGRRRPAGRGRRPRPSPSNSAAPAWRALRRRRPGSRPGPGSGRGSRARCRRPRSACGPGRGSPRSSAVAARSQRPTDQPSAASTRSEQVMRRPRQVLGVRPGGQHAQVGIELQGVGVDDLAAGRPRQTQRQGRLAACGGSGDQPDAGFHAACPYHRHPARHGPRDRRRRPRAASPARRAPRPDRGTGRRRRRGPGHLSGGRG